MIRVTCRYKNRKKVLKANSVFDAVQQFKRWLLKVREEEVTKCGSIKR